LAVFARSSGLLAGIWIGLTAIAACGAVLLSMPQVMTAMASLDSTRSAWAVAALGVSALALLSIPLVLRRALLAGDRSWQQDELQTSIERSLEASVTSNVEQALGRAVVSQVWEEHGIGSGPVRQRGQERFELGPRRDGVVADIRLRRLVHLRYLAGVEKNSLSVDPMVSGVGLATFVVKGQPIVWSSRKLPAWLIRRAFTIDDAPKVGRDRAELDRLQALALAAVREDNALWYSEITQIIRNVFLHLIAAWRRFDVVPGQAPSGNEVGLTPLIEHVRAQVAEIIDLDREDLVQLAVDVPHGAGLRALNEGEQGVALAGRMVECLCDISGDALGTGSTETATFVASYSSGAAFALLRAFGWNT
jgi:hypothetical protein